MPDLAAVADDLLLRLPLPLAQLYRRAHNAKTPRDAHDCALYLWEAALKLTASAAIVTLAADREPSPEIAERLKCLSRPSLGHWRELVRLLVPALAGRDTYAALGKLLDERRADLPRCAALDLALRQAIGAGGGPRQTVCVGELLDRLVEYRNKAQGHAAPAAKIEIHFRPLADALLAAAAELLPKLDILAGRQLVAVTEIRAIRTTWLVERSELRGVAPWRIASLELPRTEGALPAVAVGLYLVDPARPDEPAAFLSLRPLLDYDAERETVAFLNAHRGKHIEMLCYTTGDRFHLAPGESPGGHVLDLDFDESIAGEPGASATGVGRMIGDYELVSELGRGAMGIVYRARQLALGREVALKVQPRPNDPKADARFRREVRALARVDHPNLVKVFTSGVEGEQFYYTMELLDGAPLTAISDALTRGDSSTAIDLPQWQSALSAACDEVKNGEKPLSDVASRERERPESAPYTPVAHAPGSPTRNYIHQIVALMRQTADAAHALHENGVLHRDIKPGNIQVTPDGGQAVLLDLGLAQLADDVEGRLTRTTQFVGTRRYASPEQQIDARTVDRRSDVYSLGATLWELIALRPLFNGTDETPLPELIQRVQRDEPTRLRSICPAAGRDLEAVVHKCLEKRPEHRYATAGDLAADLGRVLDGEPVTARAVGTLDRAVKWVRRRPKEAATFGFGLLTVLLLLVGGSIAYLWRAALDARDAAKSAEAIAQAAKDQAEDANQNLDIALGGERKLGGELAAANKKLDFFLYAERIQLAHARWLTGDVLQARQLLAQCRPEPGKPDLRGWEWRYLRKMTEGSYATIYGHPDWVNSVAFSPDGARVASASRDHTVRVWETATGKELAVLRGHAGEVNSVVFSPNGARLASGSSDKTVRVWEIDMIGAGHVTPRVAVLRGHAGCVNSVAFSPDGVQLASASEDHTVHIWKIERIRVGDVSIPLAVLRGHADPVTSVAFSPDGAWLASAAGDIFGTGENAVRVWAAATGKELAILRGHEHCVTSVAFSPDGVRLASGSNDQTVRMWDRATSKELAVLRGHNRSVNSVAFSPDGAQLASGGDQTVRMWEAATGKELATLRGHTGPVYSVAFSTDGARLTSGSGDQTVRMWATPTGRELAVLRGHTREVNSVAFSPDGARLASGSGDRTVRLWETVTGNELAVLYGHTNAVKLVAFSPDGARLASMSYDRTMRLWETATGKQLAVLRGPTYGFTSMAFSPNGARLVSGSIDRTVCLWETATGKELAVLHGHTDVVTSVAISPDGTLLASGAGSEFQRNDPTVRLWEAATGKELAVLRGHTEKVTSVAFSPDGARLVSGSNDRTIRLWETATGKEMAVLYGHTDWVNSVAFSPNGARLVSTSNDCTVRVWETATGKELAVMRGHTEMVRSVALFPDGARLASGSADQTLRVWETVTGKNLAVFRGHTDAVSSVAFSADGSQLLSGSNDRTARMWSSTPGRELATLGGHTGKAISLAFSPDGVQLASGSEDQTVRLWETTTGKELAVLRGHTGRISSVAFSPDGGWLASGSGSHVDSTDNTVRVWETATGKELAILRGHTDEVMSVAFSLDGSRLASRDKKGGIRVWNARSGQPLDNAEGEGILAQNTEQAIDPTRRILALPQADSTIALIDMSPPTPQEIAERQAQAAPRPQWHKDLAEHFEKSGNWFAARFHLDQLLKLEPANADYRKRRDHADAEWKKSQAK